MIKEIIKKEWEKEFPYDGESASLFDESIFYHVYGSLIEKICVKVWNEAIETAADNADADYTLLESFDRITGKNIEVYVIKDSILKLKI